MNKVRIEMTYRGDPLVSPGEDTVIDAITQLHAAISALRRLSAPVFDPSFGEQAPSLLAPSETELSTLFSQ